MPENENPEFLDYTPRFLDEAEADAALARLWLELDWSQREITLFGRRVMQPRLIAWHGEAGAVYTYSGLTLQPLPWHPLLQDLRERIEVRSGHRFNSVLANAYRDGRDSMGWHADKEKELGPQAVVASLSLGAPRRFLLRPVRRRPGDQGGSFGLNLESGSLLLMQAGCQQRYQHAVPRTRRETGLRINLTYRWIVGQAPD
ncbi:MAG: alpha-ketoglutarate-dependent dioxygenase AlkB family protein [Lysobacterales bacterium]